MIVMSTTLSARALGAAEQSAADERLIAIISLTDTLKLAKLNLTGALGSANADTS